MPDNQETTILQFSCACRKVTGSATIPSQGLPLPITFCHCNICRHQTGLLCGSYLTLPDGSTNVSFQGPLTTYKTSKNVSRSFCSHCGANILFHDSNYPRPDICSGVLAKGEGTIKPREHIFAPDTKDGGLTPWLPEVPAWEGFCQQSEQAEIKVDRQVMDVNGEGLDLHAHCQCQGVRFKITRPNEQSRNLTAPYPDLLQPISAGNAPDHSANTEWWLSSNGKKYLAGTCACNSCRLASGFDIQVWAFVPRANIVQLNGDSIDFSIGSLTGYRSSEGIERHFCRTCGATVFWCSEKRPGIIDVSVGLLDADEGARAESWLEWQTDRVSFEEEARSRELVSKLSAGLKLWGCRELSSSTRT